jgi:hypothetical protein
MVYLDDESTQQFSFELFPNPFSDAIYINAEQEMEYEIYDLVGTLMEKGKTLQGSMLGRSLPQGLYTVKVKCENYETLHKVVKH